MAIIPGIKKLCTPALVYFIISVISIIVMAFQNYGNTDLYCLGVYSCNVTSVGIIFVLKFIYVLFWTWVLNIICRNGYENVSWFLVLFPYILLFVLLGLLMIKL
jgi:hypothetical protein